MSKARTSVLAFDGARRIYMHLSHGPRSSLWNPVAPRASFRSHSLTPLRPHFGSPMLAKTSQAYTVSCKFLALQLCVGTPGPPAVVLLMNEELKDEPEKTRRLGDEESKNQELKDQKSKDQALEDQELNDKKLGKTKSWKIKNLKMKNWMIKKDNGFLRFGPPGVQREVKE